MRIEYLPLDDVAERAAPTNAKAHEVERIAGSMQQLGFFDPVVLDERTGLILAGHGRVEALQVLQVRDPLAPPANIDLSDGDGDELQQHWRVPVVHGWASSDDEHAEAARLAANRLGERGGWDTAKLTDVLGPLEGTELMWATGWDPDDLEDLLAQTGDVAEITDVPDDAAGYSEAAPEPAADDAPQPAPRRAQGLREAYLVMTVDQHADYEQLVKRMRAWRGYSTDEPIATFIIDALTTALGDS